MATHPPMRALVCGIGRVITGDSILNFILRSLGRPQARQVIYDGLTARAGQDADAWVEAGVLDKVDAMAGCSLDAVATILQGLALTPGLAELVEWCGRERMHVLLCGPVPRLFTELLLQPYHWPHLRVVGSELRIVDGRIAGVETVCTPSGKRAQVADWLARHGLEAAQCWAIGDASGDRDMLQMVPWSNRISFGVGAAQALEQQSTPAAFSGDMDALLRHVQERSHAAAHDNFS
jgi:phosphoserine phosphatase